MPWGDRTFFSLVTNRKLLSVYFFLLRVHNQPFFVVVLGFTFPRVLDSRAANLEQNLTDDACHPLVQYLAHDQVEQSLLLPHEQGLVVRVPGQVVQGVGSPPQHVQACPH